MLACRPETAAGRWQKSYVISMPCWPLNSADQQSSEPVRPRAENPSLTAKPAVHLSGGDFFAIRMRKNTTAQMVAWTGHVWPVIIPQAMGGQASRFCSDPIPPVAVATDQPAKHVLSRSAGGERASRFNLGFLYRFFLHLSYRLRTKIYLFICPVFGIFQDVAAYELHIGCVIRENTDCPGPSPDFFVETLNYF